MNTKEKTTRKHIPLGEGIKLLSACAVVLVSWVAIVSYMVLLLIFMDPGPAKIVESILSILFIVPLLISIWAIYRVTYYNRRFIAIALILSASWFAGQLGWSGFIRASDISKFTQEDMEFAANACEKFCPDDVWLRHLARQRQYIEFTPNAFDPELTESL